MTTYIIVAVAFLVVGILLGMIIQGIRLARKVRAISDEANESIEKAIDLEKFAEDFTKEAEDEKKKLREQRDIAVRLLNQKMEDFEEFKKNVRIALRELAKKVKQKDLNPSAFARALKAVGDGDFTLKGDGYDYN